MKYPATFSLSKQAREDLDWMVADTGLSKTAILELSVQTFRRLWTTPIITFVREQSGGQDTSILEDEP